LGFINTGDMYRDGHGVAVDYQAAVEYYAKAGNTSTAQYRMAELYLKDGWEGTDLYHPQGEEGQDQKG